MSGPRRGISPSQKRTRKLVVQGTIRGVLVVGFPFGSSSIRSSILNDQVKRWKQRERLLNLDETAFLLAFSSRPGSTQFNQGLARRRAEFVYQYLASKGAQCKFRPYIYGEDLWRQMDEGEGRLLTGESFDHPEDRTVLVYMRNEIDERISMRGKRVRLPRPAAPRRPKSSKKVRKVFLTYLANLAKSILQGQGAPVPGPTFGLGLGVGYLKGLSEKNKALAINAYGAGVDVGLESANRISIHSASLTIDSFSAQELHRWIDNTPHIRNQLLPRSIGPFVPLFGRWKEFFRLGIEHLGNLCTSLLTDTTTHAQRKSRIQAFVNAARQALIRQGL